MKNLPNIPASASGKVPEFSDVFGLCMGNHIINTYKQGSDICTTVTQVNYGWASAHVATWSEEVTGRQSNQQQE